MSRGTEMPVLREDSGPVVRLILNRPEVLNALNRPMLDALNQHLADIESTENVRAVIVAAAGRAFSAGADLKEVLGSDGGVAARRLLSFERSAAETFGRLAALPVPVIAEVNGTAMAGGLELMLHCDLVVASSSSRIGDGHINYGLLPGAGGAARLPRVIGPTRAKYLAFTGVLMAAVDAQAMGLVNEVVDPDQLESRTAELASAIAQRSPSSLRLFKQAIDDGPDQPLPSAMRLERLVMSEHLHSGDVDEGLRAFVEKRTPDFGTDRSELT